MVRVKTDVLVFNILGINILGINISDFPEAYLGVAIAHGCHLGSVLILFYLSECISSSKSGRVHKDFALLAAAFHIISPAGMFLSAPYAEGPFALFNFLGFYLYIKARRKHEKASGGSLLMLASALAFGLATTLRSNGLLSGSLFVYDAISEVYYLVKGYDKRSGLRRLCATIMAGSVMALGMLVPQYIAYVEYCGASASDPRPWCSNWLPSIYTWVQKHYW